jgi:hypothetical protein
VLARTGEPLIIPPTDITTELFAVGDSSGEYQLNIGDPRVGPPRMTLQEFINRYYDGDVEGFVAQCCDDSEETDLNAEVDECEVVEHWAATESPNALAYNLLDGLDLGPDLNGPGAVGELQFICGPCPGNDYLGVHATDALTLTLLQQRLSQLRTGIHVRIADEGQDHAK